MSPYSQKSKFWKIRNWYKRCLLGFLGQPVSITLTDFEKSELIRAREIIEAIIDGWETQNEIIRKVEKWKTK